MSKVTTEQLHDMAAGIDARPLEDVAAVLLQSQSSAARAAESAAAVLASGACAMAESIQSGGRLYYVAAGSSGLMAASDAMELGGTFGIPAERIRIVMAGGLPTSAHMPGGTEDATAELSDALAGLSARDTVIAVSASGSTPFTLEAARLANATGAAVIGIANNADAPLFAHSTHIVALPTPPEVLSGSTRLGSGTAQKIALNTLSTLMGMKLGHIYDGMMVNVRADNAKLRDRAHRVVGGITKAPEAAVADALAKSDGSVKLAALIAAGAETVDRASILLEESGGHLRPALNKIRAQTRDGNITCQTERTNP